MNMKRFGIMFMRFVVFFGIFCVGLILGRSVGVRDIARSDAEAFRHERRAGFRAGYQAGWSDLQKIYTERSLLDARVSMLRLEEATEKYLETTE